MTLHFSQHILHSDQFGYARHRLRYILIANPRATVARQDYENNDLSISEINTGPLNYKVPCWLWLDKLYLWKTGYLDGNRRLL